MDGRRTLAGRYRLDEVIGHGGMSTVYRASDLALGRTVAVKVLLPALAVEDPTYVARFEREARAAAALAHPSVVTIYDTGADGESRFIVMEYVEGRSVAELLREGPLPVAQAVHVARAVADALAGAHAAGILHRDVKPANVMVDPAGLVKVLDFGVARLLSGATITQAASVVGTAAYMPPERAEGAVGDARSDVYSLGCLLYAMLAGAPPFTGEAAAVVLHQHLHAHPAPVSTRRAGVPRALDGLVLEMLAKEPLARPQSAAEVGRRLASLDSAGGEDTSATVPMAPVLSPAPLRTTIPPVPPPTGRTPVLVALAAAAVLLAGLIALVAGGGGSKTAAHISPSRARTHVAGTTPTTTPATTPAMPTTATTPTVPAPPAPKLKPKPKPHPKPPGHGGEPPGQAKKGNGGD